MGLRHIFLDAADKSAHQFWLKTGFSVLLEEPFRELASKLTLVVNDSGVVSRLITHIPTQAVLLPKVSSAQRAQQPACHVSLSMPHKAPTVHENKACQLQLLVDHTTHGAGTMHVCLLLMQYLQARARLVAYDLLHIELCHAD